MTGSEPYTSAASNPFGITLEMVTVILLNYKRPDNIRRVVRDIRAQSVSAKIFLWNNGSTVDTGAIDWQVASSENLYCRPRWFLAAHATTEFVCMIDDDLTFSDPEVLGDCSRFLDSRDDPLLIGKTGVVLSRDRSYAESTHLDWLPEPPSVDTWVDIVKGRFMFLHRASVETLRYGSIDRVHDDISVSALIHPGEQHLVPAFLSDRFTELPQGDVGLGKEAHWLQRREEARQRYFPG